MALMLSDEHIFEGSGTVAQFILSLGGWFGISCGVSKDDNLSMKLSLTVHACVSVTVLQSYSKQNEKADDLPICSAS